MGKKLIIILEILGAAFFLVVFANLISKYYFNNSLFHSLDQKVKVAKRQTPEDKLLGQLNSSYGYYRTKNVLSNVTPNEAATSVPAIVYHGVTKRGDTAKVDPEDISEEKFYNQMAALKKAGYTTITMDEFNAFMNGKVQLPERSFLLTFDDGKKSSFYNADPILKTLDFNAIMFAITLHSVGASKSPYYLTESELKLMVRTGRWNIQSHGKLDHNAIVIDSNGTKGRFMTQKMWLPEKNRVETEKEYEQRLYQDMSMSKKELENALHATVNNFAFPFGDYGEGEVSETILKVVGTVYPYYYIQFRPDARTGYTRSNFSYQTDTQLIRRVKVTNDIAPVRLVNFLEASIEKKLPYIDNFVKDTENWTKSNSTKDYSIGNGELLLGSDRIASSSAAFLDGSFTWTNYKFTANAQLVSGRSFALISRATDGKNMFVCTYKPDSVLIDERISGERYQLSDTNEAYTFNLTRENKVGMIVNNDVVYCLWNDKVITRTYKIIQSLPHGGIGVSVNAGPDSAGKLKLTNVKVEAYDEKTN